MTEADGLVAVTPIFSASYSGLFKSFFDVLDNAALCGKPVLIAATGGTAPTGVAPPAGRKSSQVTYGARTGP